MKRAYKVGEVYRHKNKSRQRVITKIVGDQICYHDGVGYGCCTAQHFGAMCPREVIITKKDWEIANKIRYCEYLVRETANGLYVD